MARTGRFTGVLCALLLYLTGFCAGQTQTTTTSPESALIVSGLGRGTAPLGGLWEFHTGDDPAWASPGFDDASWNRIDIARPWGDQGYWNYTGHAWYRRTIDFTQEAGGPLDIALYIPVTSCAYEIYWNGRLIGQTPYMPGQPPEVQPAAKIFTLGEARRGVLAFRVHTTTQDTITAGNQLGLIAVPQVGDREAVANFASKRRVTQVRSELLVIAQIVIYWQLAVLGAVVWLRHRKQKLLFWMFAFLLSTAVWVSSDWLLFPWLQTNLIPVWLGGEAFHAIEDIALWYLLLYLLELDRYPILVRWTKVLAWIAFVSMAADQADTVFLVNGPHVRLYQVLDVIFTIGFSVPELFPLVLIAVAFRRRMDPARTFVAIAAVLADMYFVVWHAAQQGIRFTRWPLTARMTQPLFIVDGVEVSTTAILSLLLVCAIVYAVFRYMVDEGRRQTALQQDYRSARAVQQVLVPHEIPNVPGFAIESVYKPFGEVGGDFFQIVPLNNGGLLAVIGDVSGKGMPAAMTVSLLVGTVATLASYTESPGEILAAMNARMMGRSHGGFTTCLVLRLDQNGTLTGASAGHIAPYLAGQEIALENGLPLGLAATATYEETTFLLAPGQQLTLMTDGVVEARSPDGSLFSFERTAALSTQPAEAVAAAAQQFGQDDDITVLTLTRLAVTHSAPLQKPTGILSPA